MTWSSEKKYLLFACLSIVVLSMVLTVVRLQYVGRTVKVGDKKIESPLLSANDRSRWLTIRSLADTGSYPIEAITRSPAERPVWDTIDKVMHHDRQGRLHEYSSKPTLLPTMLAPVYIGVRAIFGYDLRLDLRPAVHAVLIVGQVLPFGLTLLGFAWLLVQLSGAGSLPTSDDSLFPGQEFRLSNVTVIFLVTLASFGTFLFTFLVTLNNHSFAAIGCFWTLIAFLKVYLLGFKRHYWFVVGGLAAAFTAANELPALSFLAVGTIGFWYLDRQLFLKGYLPAVLIVAFAFFGTNLVAHNSLRPPYTHRGDGPVVAEVSPEMMEKVEEGWLPKDWIDKFNQEAKGQKLHLAPHSMIQRGRFPIQDRVEQRFVIRTFPVAGNPFEFRSVAICQLKASGKWVVKKWDNWYDYPGSYWFDGVRKGVDRGEPSRMVYFLHCMVGHHGIFSLSPIWILAVLGICIGLVGQPFERIIAIVTVFLSVLVIGFYISRPQLDRNYGGVSSGLRWTFWLIPLWIFSLAPVFKRFSGSKLFWVVAWVLLGFSVFSAVFPWSNPWVHPWIYQRWY